MLQKWVRICLLFGSQLLIQCGNGQDDFYKRIEGLGYIPYRMPVAVSGTGTVVGGVANRPTLFAHPETCFPYHLANNQTLRRTDTVSMFHFDREFDIRGYQRQMLFSMLGTGTPSIGVGFDLKSVQKIRLHARGASVEYFDGIYLQEFYNNQMTENCKELLDRVGFVVQALRVDQLEFTFVSQHNTEIQLSTENLPQFLSIDAGVKWRIKDYTRLYIDTPKYIGFQLARLQRVDKGLAIYRAAKVRNNTFVFENMGHFGLDANPFVPPPAFAPNLSLLKQQARELETELTIANWLNP